MLAQSCRAGETGVPCRGKDRWCQVTLEILVTCCSCNILLPTAQNQNRICLQVKGLENPPTDDLCPLHWYFYRGRKMAPKASNLTDVLQMATTGEVGYQDLNAGLLTSLILVYSRIVLLFSACIEYLSVCFQVPHIATEIIFGLQLFEGSSQPS